MNSIFWAFAAYWLFGVLLVVWLGTNNQDEFNRMLNERGVHSAPLRIFVMCFGIAAAGLVWPITLRRPN